ncbi:retrovirus-related pol polyprotein from transposon TNT 1-94 [Tanacetum coccineum]
MSLTAYADSDHAGCQDTRRSTLGSTQSLGDKLVSWSSKKQKSIAISNYGFQFNKIPLYCDNKSAIALCCNNIQHSRAKHIDITAEVPEIYMHQFWTTIKKIGNSDAYNFKLEKKKFQVDTEVFREILQICPGILNQDFIAPPSEEELVTFIQELGYSGKCNMLSNVDYVALLWEDFMYQADNREISSAWKEHMPYPRFTKVIINHFISKDKTISMRNKINLHTIRDDSLLGTLKFVSKTHDYQQYGALIPDDMINQDIKDSKAYKTYYDFATGKVPPRKARKYKKVASPSRKLSPIKEAEPVKKAKRVKRPAKKSTPASTADVIIRDTPGVSISKKKAPAKGDKGKGMELLSDAALLEAAQVKEALQKSKKDSHMLHATGSGDGFGSQPKLPDKSEDKTTSTDEGTGTKPGVLDVPTYESESENESWGNSQDDESNDDDDDNDSDNKDGESKDNDGNSDADDNERTDSDDDDENPSFTLKDYDEEEHDEEYESDDDNENVYEEEDDDLYKDVDVRSLGAEYEKERKMKR